MLPLIVLQLLVHLVTLVRAEPNFTSFPSDSVGTDLILTGNATISDGQLRLTANNNFSYGRAVWSQGIPFCTKNSPLSFTTDFTFIIHSSKPKAPNADGFTFFIAPSQDSPSDKSFGCWMGLMEPEDNGKPTNHLVAVEFDTCKNVPPDYPQFNDTDGNHVGINVNSMISDNSSSLDQFNILLVQQLLAARIDYNADIHKMSVYISSRDSNFTSPALQHTINLCDYVDNTSYIGFSAGSGSANVDFHDIHSWKFTSRLSQASTNNTTGSKSNSSLTPSPLASPTSSNGAETLNPRQASFKVSFICALSMAGFLLF